MFVWENQLHNQATDQVQILVAGSETKFTVTNPVINEYLRRPTASTPTIRFQQENNELCETLYKHIYKLGEFAAFRARKSVSFG